MQGIGATIRTLVKVITEAAETHPYAALFAIMPRIGKVSLGQVIGEIGPTLERAQTCEQLIAEAGVVPVTRASGKSRTVAFRFATSVVGLEVPDHEVGPGAVVCGIGLAGGQPASAARHVGDRIRRLPA